MLQEGEFSIILIEGGSGRFCEKNFVNEVLSLLSMLLKVFFSPSILPHIGGLL